MLLTARSRLTLIRVKVERAKEHLRDFEVEASAFRDAYTYVVGTQEDPKTGQARQYFARLPVARFRILAVAGDVLQNLRSALDHLAYHLASVGAPGTEPSRDVAFPICASAEIYKSAKVRKVEGMRPKAVEAIDALKPYQGGNDALWRLHEFNNIDKHKFLIPLGEDYLFEGQGFDGLYWRKASGPLFREIFGPDVNDDVEVPGAETLAEAQIGQGEPLLPFLHRIVELVDYIVGWFEPLLE